MSRYLGSPSFCSVFVAAALSVVLAGCGGGGGGGGGSGAPAIVVGTSFQGSPSTPGGGLPTIFRDEVAVVTFSNAIDADIFGGLVVAQGATTPTQFVGVSSQSTVGVAYNAFVDQTAAHAAFQVWNDTTQQQLLNAVVGRGVADPRQIVFDPVVAAGNPFSLTTSLGFNASSQYDVFIPAASNLRSGGNSVETFGGLPPQTAPGFQPQPPPSRLFRTGTAFAPDTVPPQVLEIVATDATGVIASGLPIGDTATIRVTFSEPIDQNTINLQANIIIRNLSVTTTQEPTGIVVPVSQTADATGTVFFFTPLPSFGPGLGTPPTTGYQIQVSVGSNASSADDIKDLPSGAASTQNPLANSLTQSFTTIPNAAAVLGLTLTETFSANATQDTSFTGRYNPARWNVAASGRLEGIAISGSAAPGLPKGSRLQFAIQPTAPGPVTAFFSPFDDNGVNNFGGTVNPNGGTHSQFLYLANNTEMPNGLSDSIELVEWGGAVNQGNPFAFTYNGFRMQLSHTTASAETATSFGLVSNFFINFDFDNPQNEFIQPTSHPGNLFLNEVPITVVPTQAYNVPQLASAFAPFPTLSPLFDFDDGGRTEINPFGANVAIQPSLVIDIDIPAPVQPSNNFVLGNFPTTPVPVRRVNSSSGSSLGSNQDNVANHMRFTVVGKNSSAQSLPYDLSAAAANANYVAFTTSPAVSASPANTFIIIRAEAADAFSAGVAQTVGGTAPSGVLTIVDRNGNFSQTNLDLLDTRRFCRFRFEFENDVLGNVSPFLSSFQLVYTN